MLLKASEGFEIEKRYRAREALKRFNTGLLRAFRGYRVAKDEKGKESRGS